MESKKSWIFCEAPGGADEGAAEVEEVGAAVRDDEAGFDSDLVSVLAAINTISGLLLVTGLHVWRLTGCGRWSPS